LTDSTPREPEQDGNNDDDAERSGLHDVPAELDEILEGEQVPPQTAERVRRTFRLYYSRYVEQTTGDFPPPSMVRGYEETLPGAADRLFTLAEEEGKALREDRRMLIRQRGRGQHYAFVLALTALVFGFILLLLDKSAEGLALIAADALVVAVVLATGGRQRVLDPGDES